MVNCKNCGGKNVRITIETVNQGPNQGRKYKRCAECPKGKGFLDWCGLNEQDDEYQTREVYHPEKKRKFEERTLDEESQSIETQILLRKAIPLMERMIGLMEANKIQNQ